VDVHGVRSMLDLYQVGGAQWTEILDLTREAKQKGWWHAYGVSNAGFLALETDAAVVYDYQLDPVPGLLQSAGPTWLHTVARAGERGEAQTELLHRLPR
jgi:hypothetical protein